MLGAAVLVALTLVLAIAFVALSSTYLARLREEAHAVPPAVEKAQTQIRAVPVVVWLDSTSVHVTIALLRAVQGSELAIGFLPLAQTESGYEPLPHSALLYVGSGVLYPTAALEQQTVDPSKVLMIVDGDVMDASRALGITSPLYVSQIIVANGNTWVELVLPTPRSLGVDSYTLKILLCVQYNDGWFAFGEIAERVPPSSG